MQVTVSDTVAGKEPQMICKINGPQGGVSKFYLQKQGAARFNHSLPGRSKECTMCTIPSTVCAQ